MLTIYKYILKILFRSIILLLLFPHFIERFLGEVKIAPVCRPAFKEFIYRPVLHFPVSLIHQVAVKAGFFPDFPGNLLAPRCCALVNSLMTVFKQQLMQINFYGANFCTVAA